MVSKQILRQYEYYTPPPSLSILVSDLSHTIFSLLISFLESPEQLRPLEVLQLTACYLVKDVFAKACSSSSNGGSCSGGGRSGQQRGGSSSSIAKAYVFVEDRLRAVRQDLTVQGLVLAPTAGAAEVLKTTANFYIVSAYLLSDEVRRRIVSGFRAG